MRIVNFQCEHKKDNCITDNASPVFSYVVESESLKSKAFNRKDRNRFEIINSMLVNQEMREDNELLETLDVYLNTVHLFEENLSIL